MPSVFSTASCDDSVLSSGACRRVATASDSELVHECWELADTEVTPLMITFGRSWRSGEVPEDCRKANVTPVFKKDKKEDPRNYCPVSMTSVPGKVMKCLFLDAISVCMDDRKEISNSQHGFTVWPTHFLSMTKQLPGWMKGEQWTVNPDFSKAFNIVSHTFLRGSEIGLDEWTVSWIGTWLNSRSQRFVVSGTGSSWNPATGGVPKVQHWADLFITDWSEGPAASSASSLIAVVHWQHMSGRSFGLVPLSAVQPFRRPWAGWRDGQKGTIWNSTKASSGSCWTLFLSSTHCHFYLKSLISKTTAGKGYVYQY